PAGGSVGANAGTYRIVIGATTANPTALLSDLAGNLMNQNGIEPNGEIDVDAFNGSIFLNGPQETLIVSTPTDPAVAGVAYTVTVPAAPSAPTAGPAGPDGPIGGLVATPGFTGLVALSAGDPNAIIRDKNGVELGKAGGSYVYTFDGSEGGAY